jgi:transcriptional regulator with XRE-family HTH domain
MPTFTVEQVTAARAFLGWSQHELGDASGLSFETIRDFERLKQSATSKSIGAIRAAFHDAGVDFQKRGKRIGVTIVLPWQDEIDFGQSG